MCEVIGISQLEENADAMDKALKPESVPANPSPKSEPSNKTKTEKEQEKKEKAEKEKKEKQKEERRKEQEAAAAAASSSSAKGRGGGRGNGSGTPKSPRTKEENSKTHACFERTIVVTKGWGGAGAARTGPSHPFWPPLKEK